MKNSRGWYVASVVPPVAEVSINGASYYGWSPCFEWCEQQFNEPEDIPSDFRQRWDYQGEGVFEFRKEADMMWFLLKWGS